MLCSYISVASTCRAFSLFCFRSFSGSHSLKYVRHSRVLQFSSNLSADNVDTKPRKSDEELEELVIKIMALDEKDSKDFNDTYKKRLGFKYEYDLIAKYKDAPESTNSGGMAKDKSSVNVEKTAFDVKLVGYDPPSKLKVIKEVRAITALGLKEAKELVEGVPKVLKKDLTKDEAEKLIAKLREIGAECAMD